MLKLKINQSKMIIAVLFIIIGFFLILNNHYWFFITLFLLLIIAELFSYILINNLRKDFQWLITPEDELPKLSEEGLKKFFKHGFDPELGWIRKPNTEKEENGKYGKTKYHINKKGIRNNPQYGKLPSLISCYGDSFAFARQVNDDETWEHYLSELSKSNVLNFGIGNHGIDQALLRLKREYPKNKTPVVIMGVVPSTIVRILCVWKHYNEFGNTFGFKPRFIVKKGKLRLIKNIIDSEDKFLKYKQYLPLIRKYDYFYKNKFKKELIKFPYFISILSNPLRNFPLIFLVSRDKWFKKQESQGGYPAPMKVIMKVNLKLRYNLFKKNVRAVNLFKKIVEEFVNYGKKNNFTPVFLLMPQKDDLSFIKKKKKCYYKEFINSIKKNLVTIDLTKYLINHQDLDKIYSDDNEYGGHYSNYGNKLVAEIIYKNLKEKQII